MNHIGSPEESFPSPAGLSAATTTHRQGRFAISTRKLPISKAGPIDAMTARLGGVPVPEMIFGDNSVSVAHAPTGWRLDFAAEPALDRVDKTGAREGLLQVSYARDWSASREVSALAAGIRDVVRPYDWSYSTDYRGTELVPGATEEDRMGLHGVHGAAEDGLAGERGDAGRGEAQSQTQTGRSPQRPARRRRLAPTTQHTIPLELLRRRDPILFFDEVMLYESELDDNGTSVLSVKVRVMEKRMLLLSRLFMRLDDVVVRVRDTRLYVDFDTDLVVREYTAKEGGYAELKTVSWPVLDCVGALYGVRQDGGEGGVWGGGGKLTGCA